MFLHVGNQKNIREKNIIGIFDMDNATVSSVTRRFLSNAEKHARVSAAKEEIPKSFVLYLEDPADNDSYRICMSQLSSAALSGRIGSYENIDSDSEVDTEVNDDVDSEVNAETGPDAEENP